MEMVIKDNDGGSSNSSDLFKQTLQRRFVAKDVVLQLAKLLLSGEDATFHAVLFRVLGKLHLRTAASQHVCLTLTIKPG